MHLLKTCRCWEIFRIVESYLSLQIYLNPCSIFHTSKDLYVLHLKQLLYVFSVHFVQYFSILYILNNNHSNNKNKAADHITFSLPESQGQHT